jgi:diketogulonate reductase-like aldo/keto reductase
VGQALRNVKVPREQIFITSKLWNNRYVFMTDTSSCFCARAHLTNLAPDPISHRPDRVEKALDVTLKNLGVNYLGKFTHCRQFDAIFSIRKIGF